MDIVLAEEDAQQTRVAKFHGSPLACRAVAGSTPYFSSADCDGEMVAKALFTVVIPAKAGIQGANWMLVYLGDGEIYEMSPLFIIVMRAKAGIQYEAWIPAFAGMTARK